jgi:opacity protein-like surface antigen
MEMHKKQLFKSLAGGAIALLAFAQPSQAIDNDLTLYLWGANLSGTATVGRQSIPVEMDFDELLDKLDIGLQAHYEGVGEQWGAGLDFTYFKTSDTSDAGVEATSKITLTELFGLYRANPALDILAGVRFLGMDMSMTVNGLADAEGKRSLTDFYVGARTRLPISNSVLFVLRGDAGTGDSDLVWNVVMAVDWHVSQSVALRGGYRWLDYDIDKDDGSIEEKLDMSMTGPFLGVGFQW